MKSLRTQLRQAVLPLLVSFLPVAAMAAQAPVDEIRVESRNYPQKEANQQQIEMFYQMQALQEEVRQLRGMLEEMSYELGRLKKRQQDDYMDLDRRMSGMVSGSNTAVGNTSTPASGVTVEANTPAGQAGDVEEQDYKNAYSLLRDRKVSEATSAFELHIKNYPNGKYVPNAYYWLGQIHMLNDALEDARQAFSMVVNNYPTSRKSPDAAFKLGKVYHLLGDDAKARELLGKVASGNSDAARQAQQYLSDNL